MKRKLLAIVIALTMLLAGVLVLTACDKEGLHNEHTYQWKHDETNHWEECKECSVITEENKHDFAIQTTEPTEETKGVKKFICIDCGYKYEEEIEKLPHTHNWEEKFDEVNHWEECKKCADVKDEVEHELVATEIEPTCIENAYTTYTCEACEYTYTEEHEDTAEGHNFGELIIVEESTCEESGLGYRVCEDCEHEEEDIIESVGHVFGEWEIRVDDHRHTCIYCNYKTPREDHIDHVVDEWVIKTEPTCGVVGVEVQKCICGYEVHSRNISAIDHNYIETVVPASCTEDGETIYECEHCGDTYAEAIDSLDHNFGQWVVSVEPTYFSKGIEYRLCSRCLNIETRFIDELVFEVTIEVDTLDMAVSGANIVIEESTVTNFNNQENPRWTQGRQDRFGHLGDIETFEINVSGEIDLEEFLENATDMGWGLTTFFNMGYVIPEGATHYYVIDGYGVSELVEMEVEDGVFWLEVQWIISYDGGINYIGQTGFYFIAFTDETGRVLGEYLTYVDATGVTVK